MTRMLIVGMGLLAAAHAYLWARWVRDPAWEGGWFWGLTLVVFACWLSVPVTLSASRRFSQRVASAWAWPGYLWLGTAFLATFVLIAVDVSRTLLGWTLAAVSVPPPRTVLSTLSERSWSLGSLCLVVVLVAFSVWRALGAARLERVEVTLDRLPVGMDGVTIVQLSDVHVGLTLGRRFVTRLVQTVNALEPDIVAITGDLVDGSVARLSESVAPLAALRARFGVFFVTGNHEYYAGAAQWCEHLSGLGVQVLRNERVRIGSGADGFDLAGIDDESAHHFHPEHGADLAGAVAGRDPTRELVLLAHQPRALELAETVGVGLQLSGHTHGGQIWPFNWLVPLQQPVIAGLQRRGSTQIYVSRGTGYWGPPMRLGSPPEITQIVLRSRPPSADGPMASANARRRSHRASVLS